MGRPLSLLLTSFSPSLAHSPTSSCAITDVPHGLPRYVVYYEGRHLRYSCQLTALCLANNVRVACRSWERFPSAFNRPGRTFYVFLTFRPCWRTFAALKQAIVPFYFRMNCRIRKDSWDRSKDIKKLWENKNCVKDANQVRTKTFVVVRYNSL